jgi:hypothetical protein
MLFHPNAFRDQPDVSHSQVSKLYAPLIHHSKGDARALCVPAPRTSCHAWMAMMTHAMTSNGGECKEVRMDVRSIPAEIE